MVWSIDYTSDVNGIYFSNICSEGAYGYFYIVDAQTGEVLPSTLGGIKIPQGTCASFTVPASDLVNADIYSLVLADSTPGQPEITHCQVWFIITPTPFSVRPPTGSCPPPPIGAGYNCVTPGSATPCQAVTSGAQYDTLEVCQSSCTLCKPCQTNLYGILGNRCIPLIYIAAGIVGIILIKKVT